MSDDEARDDTRRQDPSPDPPEVWPCRTTELEIRRELGWVPPDRPPAGDAPDEGEAVPDPERVFQLWDPRTTSAAQIAAALRAQAERARQVKEGARPPEEPPADRDDGDQAPGRGPRPRL